MRARLGYEPANRVNIDPGALEFEILPVLLRVAEEIYEEIQGRRRSDARPAQGGAQGGRRPGGAKLKERDPWG